MGAVCCRPTVRKHCRRQHICFALKLLLQPVDFDGEVNLFHFVLLRCVGKGAFGKVRV